MNCLKCGGVTHEEQIEDFFRPVTLLRCLLCGWVGDRTMVRHRALSLQRGVEMPKFKSEESRQAWIEAVRRTKAAKKKAPQSDPIDYSDVSDDHGPNDRREVVPAVSSQPRTIGGLALAIEDAMARLDEDRTVLVRAREILRRLEVAG